MNKPFKFLSVFFCFFLLLYSCSTVITDAEYKKPFVIVGKEELYSNGFLIGRYEYKTANGYIHCFSEDFNKYEIGDTIK